MFKYRLKIIFRSLLSNKLHSALNVAGFAIGISSFILILLYVDRELTYDRFHKNFSNIYKLTLGNEFNTMAPFAVVMKDKIPEIKKIVRIDYDMGGGVSPILRVKKGDENKSFQIKDIIYADSTFFDIFTFNLIQGDPKTSLTEPNSIILTESTANKIFGGDNPIGKTIEYIGTNENPRLNYTVTAIVKDIPDNSSIKFNGIVSFNTLKSIKPAGIDVDDDFLNWTYDTYVLINNPNSIDQLTKKTNDIWLNDISKNRDIKLDGQSISEYSSGFVSLKDVNFFKNNKLKFIYLILSVGIFIIILAVINFVNLSIAKASLRKKEIGVRKVTGATRYELFKQYIGETLVLTFIGGSVALVIVYFLMPLYEKITGISTSFNPFQHPISILIFISGLILTGIIAGIYPALFLSAFNPVAILKDAKIRSNNNKSVTRFLIIFQFVISTTLILSTIIISRQVRYMRTENVGFDKNYIIQCRLTQGIRNKYEVFKQSLLQNPNILNVASSSDNGLAEKFHMSLSDEINGVEKSFYAMAVDPAYIRTIGLNIIEGRDFSSDLESDKYKTVILNETAVKYFGLDNQALNFEIEMLNTKARVIGVIKDFHNESFQKKISPLVLWYVPGWNSNLSIRIGSHSNQETIQFIKKQWDELSPEIPFEFQFLSDRYNGLYKDEDKFNLLIGYFSIIAILIACFGLFGLVSFSTERRSKEIGIRKINGAKISEILLLLNGDFIILVIVSLIIAGPVAWYAMHKWLQNFEYKTEITWLIFVLAAIIALGIALLTVSWQSWRAATRNPVEALRYE
ncbi:MAG TPA: FtsX-like permease family protein [Bacteroidales bacterium]|nr:FtsX-like permease family protein [Bacteroidales bacterium]